MSGFQDPPPYNISITQQGREFAVTVFFDGNKHELGAFNSWEAANQAGKMKLDHLRTLKGR